MKVKEVLHIDVNNAFLSWEAAYRMQRGISDIDLRDIPSAVGGDPKARRGIVLAKSNPAKQAGIKTGETLYSAFKKCPELVVVSPNFNLYTKSSGALANLLREYTPDVTRFSIDECFLEFKGRSYENLNYIKAEESHGLYMARKISERIKNELGFTVSIGVSTNRLLAKMASELKKPDAISTIFPHEIEEKMWKLPVSELFMVGRATHRKLLTLGIQSIGELAKTDRGFLISKFGKHGETIYNYANGIDMGIGDSDITTKNRGIGNSTTISYDVTDREDALLYLLGLTEKVSQRLRDAGKHSSLVAVSVKTSDFISYSHQKKLGFSTDSTETIFAEVTALFDNMWQGEPIRHLGVRLSHLEEPKESQISFFEPAHNYTASKLDSTIDSIREKYGENSIIRASFLHKGVKPIIGSSTEEDLPPISGRI